MGRRTGIEWTADDDGTEGATWNFIRGCSRTVAEGAKTSGCGDGTGGGCYAERDGGRFCGEGQPYHGLVRLTATGPRWTGAVSVIGKHLCDPLRWQTPTKIFVASVSDPFHDNLTDDEIAGWVGLAMVTRRHTYISLTKRAKRMRLWFATAAAKGDLLCQWLSWCAREMIRKHSPDRTGDIRRYERALSKAPDFAWPLPNLWLGVSTEHQPGFDERWPQLEACPAAVRLLSCEPLIGPIDAITATSSGRLSWVIVGAESGPKSRPCDPRWIEQLRRQCAAADRPVPLFLKQAVETTREPDEDPRIVGYPRYEDVERANQDPDPVITFGVGSKRKRWGIVGLPYLNGVQYKQSPSVSRG